MGYNREYNLKTLLATIILILLIAIFAIFGFFTFEKEKQSPKDKYPWVTSDAAAIEGMLDGSYYSGKKNDFSILSYKIAEEITVGADGKGDFKIENSGKNRSLMKVKIILNEKVIYQTKYIKPNQHINFDTLDIIPDEGTYSAEAVFEGFDPNTEKSIGATTVQLTITVMP